LDKLDKAGSRLSVEIGAFWGASVEEHADKNDSRGQIGAACLTAAIAEEH